ncbi:hypothetical protein CFP65_0606 [Kitasatospora sp. MMS16-BH015]|uniref:hypothetical protein n=1 Tax=Kitasatospora sp. MMS16-BH015 TaxID=2018025 RepID=UPI000CA3A8EF|nr:hypothetical protein [Kitasatospora sp. MMS16-BH015]AUG75563.1 hypothetical protein CFP65_0606 [Kitasatospora sp. MMS16-BH015]
MGIELELHTTRPARIDYERTRATLVLGSYEHGAALASALGRLKQQRAPKLWSADPYGDTFFDAADVQTALGEIDELRACSGGAGETAAVDDLARMLRACLAHPGSSLWFMGD